MKQDSFPLSELQYAMLLDSLVAPHEGGYILQNRFGLCEAVDVPVLERAWQELIDRRAVMRTTFSLVVDSAGATSSTQSIAPHARFHLEKHDWRERTKEAQRESLSRLLAKDRARPFDLGAGPLNRFQLVRKADEDYELLWTSHHAMMDGRSYLTIATETFQLYDALRSGSSLELAEDRPYSDYLEWASQRDLTDEAAFWRDTLRGMTSPTPVPAETVRALATGEDVFAARTTELSAELTAAAASLAKRHELNVNAFVHAAWALLLHGYTGRSDVLFGSTRGSRRSPPGLAEPLPLGLALNTLPLRIPIDRDSTALDFVRLVGEQQRTLKSVEHTPSSLVRRSSSIPQSFPLFETAVVFNDATFENYLRAKGGPAWVHRGCIVEEMPHLPLTLTASLARSLVLQFGYFRRRIEDSDAAELVRHYEALFEALVARPDARLGELPFPERSNAGLEQLGEWNDTASEFPHACLHDLFLDQARQQPDAPAVVFEGTTSTYREVEARASQLATILRSRGIGRGDRVGVYLERSADLVVALLAVLLAGAAYVPLDPIYPRERIAFMLNDAEAAVVLTEASLDAGLAGSRAPRLLLDDIHLASRETEGNDASKHRATLDDLAYVIYTSGSTGQPKGVEVPHRALTNLLWSMASTPGFDRTDSLLAVTTVSFDIAALELFLPLTVGGRVEVASSAVAANPFELRSRIECSRPTVMQATPATWRMLVSVGWTGDASIKVLCGGEQLEGDLARELARRAREVWNMYGPTETTIWSSVSAVHAGQVVSIGRPIANTSFYVLDPRGLTVPPGTPGELYIGGVGVAKDYHRRPELSAERFVTRQGIAGGQRLYRTGDRVLRHLDGSVEYLSRLDDQIKLNGYRIELGEIESALRSHPSVLDAIAALREGTNGDKKLIGYVVPREQPLSISGPEMRRHLLNTLPEYMVPTQFVTISKIPLTPNGKVDRRTLPAPERENAVVTAEHDEEIIAGIAVVWRRTLQLSHVGIDDNFFDVGGKSLGVMQVVVALRGRFGVELTSVDVLRHSTIRTMARFIGETRESTDVVESREPSTGPSRAPLHALRRRRTSSDDRRD